MLIADRTAQEWFQEATRCYVARHQGCPWCGAVHAVFKVHTCSRLSFNCQSCDFEATHELVANRYQCVPGEDAATVQRAAYPIKSHTQAPG